METIGEAVESFGLTVETVHIPGHERAYRIYKGAKQIFIGTEAAVREFLLTYDKNRAGPYEGSMYGYKE